MVMVIIATISGAPTMFQLLDEPMYACYSHLLLRRRKDSMLFVGSLHLVGPSLSKFISLQQA